jgi:hypothetical protein
VQFDKEDVINIYMEKTDGSQCALLTSEQQNSVVNQADARFKVAKGKAMMPALTKDDVKKLLKDLPRDEDGMLNFHDVQDAVLKYRAQRTKDFKLVYPPLAKPVETARFSSTGMGTGTMMGGSMSMSLTQKKHHKIKKDIESVAPKTMFIHDVGLSNAEIVEQVRSKLLVMMYSAAIEPHPSKLPRSLHLTDHEEPQQAGV